MSKQIRAKQSLPWGRRLRDPACAGLSDLSSIWAQLSADRSAVSPDIYEGLGQRILSVGEPLLAYDVIRRGMERGEPTVRLRQLLGLALARSGATDEANRVLNELRRAGSADAETLGILAGTHKRLAEQAAHGMARVQHLKRAHAVYRDAYRLALTERSPDNAIYVGVNTATTGFLLGHPRKARAIAAELPALCRKRLRRKHDDYWAMATLGEAALIMGRWDEAEEWYGRAGACGKGKYGDLNATRHNARLLLARMGRDSMELDLCFGIPVVVAFAGHMIDRPDRVHARFPASLEARVRREIAACLREHADKIGYSGAACGSDILFLEEMLRQKSEVNIVLPIAPERFEAQSVDVIPGSDWKRRFRRVLARASRVIVTDERRRLANDQCFDYANLVAEGLAALRCQLLETRMISLAVWNRGRPDGPGGTASQVKRWRSGGIQTQVINIAEWLGSDECAPSALAVIRAPRPARERKRTRAPTQRIMAMLFADVVEYGALADEQVPLFVKHFMGEVGRLLAKCAVPPETRNTWGDAFYFVFGEIESAGRFALDLRDRVCAVDWKSKGLPRDISLRIALHAGPLYSCRNPITGRRTYTGSHVVRTARIEPITPPNQVYASESFAATAAAQGIAAFSFRYVGQTPLAKETGLFPTYLVHRAARIPASRR